MSSGGKSQSTPPERGSFPLDHRGQCTASMKARTTALRCPSLVRAAWPSSLACCLTASPAVCRFSAAPRCYARARAPQAYMDCMKQEKFAQGACRDLSKAYLQCRMDTCVGARRARPSCVGERTRRSIRPCPFFNPPPRLAFSRGGVGGVPAGN